MLDLHQYYLYWTVVCYHNYKQADGYCFVTWLTSVKTLSKNYNLLKKKSLIGFRVNKYISMLHDAKLYFNILYYCNIFKTCWFKSKIKPILNGLGGGGLLQQNLMTTAMVQCPDKCAKQRSTKIQYSMC